MHAAKELGLTKDEAGYYVFSDQVENALYSNSNIKIGILMKSGKVQDISEVSEQYDLATWNRQETKYFLCYPASIASKVKENEAFG
jgi:hypothetical protein